MGQLTGKVAIVTGGSRGIGRAVAAKFAIEGASIVITCRDAGATGSLMTELGAGSGSRVVAVSADVTDIKTIPGVFERAQAEFGGVDILVNNAGVLATAAFVDLKEDDYDQTFAFTKGVYFMMREAALRLRDGGRIISLSTGLTRNWAPDAAAYAGSKAAIEVFTRSLSKELGKRLITVNTVLPGVTETDMTAGFSQEKRRGAAQQTAFGRLGLPSDVADVVCFLASEESRWITGQAIVVNGGSTP